MKLEHAIGGLLLTVIIVGAPVGARGQETVDAARRGRFSGLHFTQ